MTDLEEALVRRFNEDQRLLNLARKMLIGRDEELLPYVRLDLDLVEDASGFDDGTQTAGITSWRAAFTVRTRATNRSKLGSILARLHAMFDYLGDYDYGQVRILGMWARGGSTGGPLDDSPDIYEGSIEYDVTVLLRTEQLETVP